MDAIANVNCIQHLEYLLEFLAAWKERPACLTPIAYQWCSAFSEKITRPGQDGTYTRQDVYWDLYQMYCEPETRFTKVGPGCDLVHHAHRHQTDPDLCDYVDLLFKTLEIWFRLVLTGHDRPPIHLDHTSHHNRMFEVAFSSDDDETIADAMCAWITDSHRTPSGLFARHFANRTENTTPLPQRLRQMAIRAICRIWRGELTVSTLEIVRSLNRLEVDVGDVGDEEEKVNWVCLLVGVIRSPTGFESLSSHNWHLLDELISTTGYFGYHMVRDTDVMRLLEEAEDWEKLEVWLAALWRSLQTMDVQTPELMEGIEQVTLELSSRQPSALQRLENLCERDAVWGGRGGKLQGICYRVRAGQLPSEPPPPPYVSGLPA